jgi:hypothetical protein
MLSPHPGIISGPDETFLREGDHETETGAATCSSTHPPPAFSQCAPARPASRRKSLGAEALNGSTIVIVTHPPVAAAAGVRHAGAPSRGDGTRALTTVVDTDAHARGHGRDRWLAGWLGWSRRHRPPWHHHAREAQGGGARAPAGCVSRGGDAVVLCCVWCHPGKGPWPQLHNKVHEPAYRPAAALREADQLMRAAARTGTSRSVGLLALPAIKLHSTYGKKGANYLRLFLLLRTTSSVE